MLINLKIAMKALMSDLCIDSFSQEYILRRFTNEGIIFLTVELVKVSKAVITSLELGFFDRSTLTSFRSKGSILHLFEELLSRIFDKNTGKLLLIVDSNSIWVIRQVTEYLYKLALEFTDEQKESAKTLFVSNEEEMRLIGSESKVLAFANQLRKDFETYYPEISRKTASDILSAHRPRGTAGTYIDGTDHYYFDRISLLSNQRLPSMAAYEGVFKPYPSAKVKVKLSSTLDFSELLLVPKDSRGPRTICREDRVRLETQMAYFDFMVSHLEPLSGYAINFRDQTVNRRVAEESSTTKAYCTLDLKDASDRVSYKVVKTIFRNSPGCFFFVTGDRRASNVKVDSRTIKLSKLAGMGSGLTFPTMSLLISLAICNRVRRLHPCLSYRSIRSRICIYGDDICCPTEWYAIAVDALDLIGLKVNASKSFVTSNFRESCGGDYYNGTDVTPVRLRLSNSKPVDVGCGVKLPQSPNAFKQLYEHSKECFAKGLIGLSKYYMSVLQQFHISAFGFKMVAGRFDSELSIFVDYTKGTSHIPVGKDFLAYTVAPVSHRSSKIIDGKGSLLERCPYKYLSNSFNREAIDLFNIATPSSFEEVVIPRCIKFVRKLLRSDFILPLDLSFTRDHFESQIRRNNSVYALARFMTFMSFDSAV